MNHSAKWVYLTAGQDDVGLEDVAKVFPALGSAINEDSAVWRLYSALYNPSNLYGYSTCLRMLFENNGLHSWSGKWNKLDKYIDAALVKPKPHFTCHGRAGCIEATNTELCEGKISCLHCEYASEIWR